MKLTQPQFDTLTAKGLKPQKHAIAGFAEASFDDNSVESLLDFNEATPDRADMDAWEIDADQWRNAQREALETAMYYFEQDKKTATVKRVSDKGWHKIVEWIKATKNDDHDYSFDSAAAEAWCTEAEESMGNGNPPMVEMPGNATMSGHPETFTVPADCIYEVEDEDEAAGGEMKSVISITGIEIKSARVDSGQLFIECAVVLSDGQSIDYTSCNEVENLESLQNLGGAQSGELKDALGEDYLNDVAHHLIKAAEQKWGELDFLLADCQNTKATKLAAAISSTDTSGFPGVWSVEVRADGDTMLIWTCDKNEVPEMDGDEPWTKGAGYEIIKAAGIGDYSDQKAGADAYQDRNGDNVVTQWVCFDK